MTGTGKDRAVRGFLVLSTILAGLVEKALKGVMGRAFLYELL